MSFICHCSFSLYAPANLNRAVRLNCVYISAPYTFISNCVRLFIILFHWFGCNRYFFCFLFFVFCFVLIDKMMARSLRSNSRSQKLQLQHIQQVNEILRVKLNDRINTKNDNFEQTEFLSLFGLTPKISKSHTKNGFLSPKRKRHTDDRISNLTIQSKLKKTLGKPKNVRMDICIYLIINFNRSIKQFGLSIVSISSRFLLLLLFSFSGFLLNLETHIKSNQHMQTQLLARRQSILNELRDTVADKRKYNILYEHERQMNIILKITFEDLLNNVIFICNT